MNYKYKRGQELKLNPSKDSDIYTVIYMDKVALTQANMYILILNKNPQYTKIISDDQETYSHDYIAPNEKALDAIIGKTITGYKLLGNSEVEFYFENEEKMRIEIDHTEDEYGDGETSLLDFSTYLNAIQR